MIRPFDKPVYVTRPFLPPLEKFCDGLKDIWENRWVTNDGPVAQRFAKQLAERLKTENVCLFSNGALALEIAIEGMRIGGEVITTPFTYVTTANALFRNKVRPVFVDVEPDYYTLDPEKVEAAITPWTTAILPVHIFGYPCNVDALEDIAERHNLKLIYDAAHAFGVEINDTSIAHCGDVSMFSFHATKMYHSVEGGMLAFRDSGLRSILEQLRNHGFVSETEVVVPGTNANMNEIQALMGSMMLEYVEMLIEERGQIAEMYRRRLREIPGIKLPPKLPPNVRRNHVYMPIEVCEDEFGMSRDQLYAALKGYNIYSRRYFYPLVCDYPCYRSLPVNDPLTIARKAASQILALPLYNNLSLDDVERICDIIITIQATARAGQATSRDALNTS